MKAEFYDVKMKAKVEADVVAKVVIEKNGRFAFKGQTADGRSLTRFVSKADFDAAVIDAPKPAGKSSTRKCCKKK